MPETAANLTVLQYNSTSGLWEEKALSALGLIHTDISDFDAGVQANRLDQMAAPTGAVDFNSQQITGLAEPSLGTDAATKNYVDNAVAGKDTLAELTDVNITSRAANQVLVVDSGNTEWINALLVNANISASAAIAYSKLAALTDGNILVGSITNVPTSVSMSGDVTIINSGATTIANDAVTFAKMQNISTDRLLGRDTAGSGDTEEISLNASLEFTGAGAIQRAALTGDVTASAGSNSTTVANVSDGALSSNVVLINQANTYGAFAQRFPTTQLQLDNPAQTFQYIFATSAIVADRTVTLPLLGSNDVFVFESATQTLANKTLTTPTIADFSNATHDHLDAAGGGTLTKAAISDFAHQASHQSGGGDALTGNLDATARTSVSKNSTADVGARRTLNFIEGSNITLTIADDAGGEEVDITITSTAGGGSPLTTKGDVYGYDTSDARIPVGSNNQVFMADSAQALGVKYALIANANLSSGVFGNITGLGAQSQTLDMNGNNITDAGTVQADTFEVINAGAGTNPTLTSNSATNNLLLVNDQLAINNVGAGADPIFFSNDAGQVLDLTGSLDISGTLTAGTYVGQSSIVTLGTITTGVWNGTDIVFANIQQIATDRLLGRDTAATGDIEELTVSGGIEFTGAGGIQTSAFTGDVAKSAGGTALTAQPAIISGQSLVTPVSTDMILIWDATDSQLKRVDASNFLSGASQTPWTSDIDAAGFDLTSISNLEFQVSTGAPTAGTPAIYNNASGIKINVPTGDSLEVRVQGTLEAYINATEISAQGNNVIDVASFIQNGTAAGAGAVRLVNSTGDIGWRNTLDDHDYLLGLDNSNQLRFTSTEGVSTDFVLFENDSTPTSNAQIAGIFARGITSTAAAADYVDILFFSEDITNTSKDGSLWIQVFENNTKTAYLKINDAGAGLIEFFRPITIPSTSELYLDGGGDTYLVEDVANTIHFIAGGVSGPKIDSAGDFIINSGDRFYWDGKGDSWLEETSADRATFTVGGQIGLELRELNAEVNVLIGKQAILAAASTDGFLYIPYSSTGAFSGTPTAFTGKSAFGYDQTNNNLMVYDVGESAWKSIGGGGSSPPFADTQTIIEGSVDNTKLLRFEIDGFTTGTTRVLTPQNADYTISGLETSNVYTALNSFNRDGSPAQINFSRIDTFVSADEAGKYQFLGDDSAGNPNNVFGQFIVRRQTGGVGTFDGQFLFQVAVAGSSTNALRLLGNASRVDIESGFDFSVASTKKIFLDGGGNTSIRESAADNVLFEVGGTDIFELDDAVRVHGSQGLALDTTLKLWLDSGNDTYIDEPTGNQIRFTAGGTRGLLVANQATNPDVVIGSSGALATTATEGFLYMDGGAGTPTGTPTGYTGKTALFYDTTNNILYANDGGGWSNVGGGGSEVFTWTADHNTGGFALTFASDTTDPASSSAFLNWDMNDFMQFNVPTGDQFAYKIAGTVVFQIGPTEITQTAVDGLSTLNLYDNRSGAPSDGVSFAAVDFESDTDTTEKVQFGQVKGITGDVTNATSSGRLQLLVRDDNTLTPYVEVDGEARNIEFFQDVIIPATNLLYVDGGGDTYITEVAANAMEFQAGGSRNLLLNNKSVVVGINDTTTSRTDNFLMVTTTAGTPTGVPAVGNSTGRVALAIDTNNDLIYIYNSTWKAMGASGEVATWTTNHSMGSSSLVTATSQNTARINLGQNEDIGFENSGGTANLLSVEAQSDDWLHFEFADGEQAVLTVEEYLTSASGTSIHQKHARGTKGSESASVSGDILGSNSFWGWGTSWYETARMRARANQTFSGTVGGSYLEFSTTPDGGQSLTLQMVLENNGDLFLEGGGNLILAATSQLFLDGGGNTSLRESAADVITFEAGGTDIVSIDTALNVLSANIEMNSSNRIRWASDDNRSILNNVNGMTYAVDTGDYHSFLIGGTENVHIDATSFEYVLAATSPQLILRNNVATPPTNTGMGSINFWGKDSGGTATEYARIIALANDDTDTAEKGRLYFYVNNNGTVQTALELRMDEGSIRAGTAFDFMVENSHFMIFDGTTSAQTIGGDAGGLNFNLPTGDTYDFFINSVSEAVLSATTFNLPSATFQENGVDISPIGIHDVYVGAAGMWAPTTEPATGLTPVNFGTNNITKQVWEFTSTSADERVQFTINLPRNWNEGTITIVLNWSFASGSGDVRWAARGVATGDNDAIDAAFGTAVAVNDTAGTANQIQVTSLPTITIAGSPAAGDEIQIEVFRNGSNAGDTFSGTARLHGATMYITTDAATAA